MYPAVVQTRVNTTFEPHPRSLEALECLQQEAPFQKVLRFMTNESAPEKGPSLKRKTDRSTELQSEGKRKSRTRAQNEVTSQSCVHRSVSRTHDLQTAQSGSPRFTARNLLYLGVFVYAEQTKRVIFEEDGN